MILSWKMDKAFLKKLYEAHINCPGCPEPERVHFFFNNLLSTLFPDFFKKDFASLDELELHFEELKNEFGQILYKTPNHKKIDIKQLTENFFDVLPVIHQKLSQDVKAMYEGDPAAKSPSEVIHTYPGFYAISAYRIAHQLHKMKIQAVPRLITELSHSKTGIDIHPGARIGDNFCIDHGTGIVIGETTVIGDHVKIYQGVTLGALSVNKEDAEKKRHPTIEDNVTIYAGATILGGETVIGHDSIIGGNVWLTKSVPPSTQIYYQARMHNKDTDETDLMIYKTKL